MAVRLPVIFQLDIISMLKIIIALVLLIASIFYIYQTAFPPNSKKAANLLIAPVTENSSVNTPQVSLPSVSVERIFISDHSWTATLSAEKKVTMIATGDVIPARSVNTQVSRRKDFTWPYLKTVDVLQDANITFINLETPLIADCPITVEGMIFCGDAQNVDGLVFAGVDIANLANNHAGNHGLTGINSTRDLLQKNGIQVVGTGGPIYKEVHNIRFAFLGYNDIGYKQDPLAWTDEDKIASDIKQAKENSDIIVVTYHWGVEYRDQPDSRQKQLAHFTIDAGADLVIGNHPHWIQPVEMYKGKLITYAHGNFVFDQQWSLKTKQGVVGKYTFYNKQLTDVEFLPVLIQDYGQPSFLEGGRKQEIVDDMKKRSELLQSSMQ